LINVAIPDDSNFKTKEIEKLNKYKHIEIEFSRIWKLRTQISSIIIGPLGTIKKGLDQNLQLILVKVWRR
jgi:hypothetical protein